MNQWEYLEVVVDLSKKTWKDSEGRRGKLRKGSLAVALNEIGTDGWELSASLSEKRSTHHLLFKRPWLGDDAGEDADDDPGRGEAEEPVHQPAD